MRHYMLSKNIIKFCGFLILISLISLFTSSCSGVFPQQAFRSNNEGLAGDAEKSKDYAAPKIVASIKDDAVTESSGVAASRCNTGVFWTHNDSGDDAFLFAFNLSGQKLGVWRIPAAKNIDWEDIAAYKDANGKCFLYIGDTGNNARNRGELTIYKVPEPVISDSDKDSNKSRPVWTEPADAIRIEYPDMRHDAETLMVHPQSGDIYVLSKSYSHEATVYKLAAPYDLTKVNQMKNLGTIAVPAFPNGTLTGGDISPDGTRAIVVDYFNAYELALPAGVNFDEIWKQKSMVIELGPRKTGEAIAYSTDGKFLIATSEGKNSPIIKVDRK